MSKSPLDLHISKKLKAIRLVSRINQNELGELVGLTAQQIQKYENGINRIHAGRLYEIAQILGKPISSFFEGYVDDSNYYNFTFRDEQESARSEEIENKEIINLIKAFKGVQDPEVRKNIIALIDSLS